MATELEVSKNGFYSDYRGLMEIQQLAVEDARFLTFVGFLTDNEIYSTPISSRFNGTYKNGNWSILGYCFDPNDKFSDEDENDFDEDDAGEKKEGKTEALDKEWSYTIFNGLFSTSMEVRNASKTDINKCISDTVRFIEMTLDKKLISDVCEARELQDHIINQNATDSVNRIDVCIITDLLIEQENLENKILIKKYDLEVRIYYWDLKKYNDLKRSKQKRLPININFKNSDYSLYDINYISKKIDDNLSYYLAIFPAKLIADLYSHNRTQLLENNVRVFLQTKKTANADMKKTILEDPKKFFSFNNGISATAESVITENGKIITINDFQIVNGGQTTATLDLCNKSSSLNDVYVSVKITSLSKDKNYSDIVSKISEAANTQTAVKKSDFQSGRPILIEIERLSRRNVVLDDQRRSIYFFFERMAGQYNVTRNFQGNERKMSIWEKGNPRALAFDKIDIARWYNAMNLKPYLAAEGAEKQFKDFINNGIKEIDLNRYKTLLGFGLLFNRIKKLCGTSNGKIYPSLTLDQNGNHTPVAMSTALYSISILHEITNQCFDYWGVYEFKYGVANSLIDSNVRIQSELDDILVEIIKNCWDQILHFGGAAAQEKSKVAKTWELVKGNIIFSENFLMKLKPYLVSPQTIQKRNSKVSSNEYELYFDQLNVLLSNDAKKLYMLLNATSNQTKFKAVNIEISNFLSRLSNGDQNLNKKKVQLIFQEYENFVLAQFNFNVDFNVETLEIGMDLNEIYQHAIFNSEDFIENFRNKNFPISQTKKLIEIIEKLYREYALSLNDLKFINESINQMKVISL